MVHGTYKVADKIFRTAPFHIILCTGISQIIMVLWPEQIGISVFYVISSEIQGRNMWTTCLQGNLVPSDERSTNLQERQPRGSSRI